MGNSDIIRSVMMIKTLSVLIMLLLGDNSIQSLVDEACLLSGGPGLSVGIIKDDYPDAKYLEYVTCGITLYKARKAMKWFCVSFFSGALLLTFSANSVLAES